ncbi:hypothetical protein NQ315_001411 [Exocentrus adspersus]|uniref:Fibronectin type-III domain-containing protein n=1 Tax=Exocentrus adspersus TaxID=1586481 RepID=A0AAV8WER9_9CUCU|nr:hypothetical protein NQ315_001411 [Exocentrus adspersus]
MVGRGFFLVFVAVLGLAAKIEACVPLAVENLRIHPNGTLTWDVSTDETCVADSFQVVVEGDREDDYDVTVRDTFVDLSFLKTCEQWKFYVTPVAAGVVGHQTRLIDWIPLPRSADLTIDYLNVTIRKRHDVVLNWDLRNRTHGDCTLEYRLAITDTETATIRDVYFTGRSFRLQYLSPCVPYHLALRAVNTAIGGIEGPIISKFVDIPAYPEDPPTLRSVNIGPTAIDMSWRLENYIYNRCPVENFYLDSSTGTNFSIPILDPAGRPPVHISVSGLKPSTIYNFRAYVKNSGGVSTSVPMAVQTKELSGGQS